MIAADFVQLLKEVQQFEAYSWIANCPAHQDQNQSLLVSQCGNTVLLKCSAGCNAAEILNEMGLALSHLFEPPDTWNSHLDGTSPRAIFSARHALDMLGGRATLVVAAAVETLLERATPLSAAELQRARTARDIMYRVLELIP